MTAHGKQRAILLSVCGADTYKLISSLVSPDKPGDKTFDELISLTKNHFNPKPSVIVERYKFNSHVRQQGQSVAVFIAELRRLAQHCDYGETLNDMLRDRLVCGINDDRIQRRLLSESSLQFQKAWEMARAMELAEKNVKDIQKNTEIVSVSPAQLQANKLSGTRHKVKRQGKQQAPSQPQGSTNKCYRCGRTDHTAQNCRARSYNCQGLPEW